MNQSYLNWRKKGTNSVRKYQQNVFLKHIHYVFLDNDHPIKLCVIEYVSVILQI